MPNVIAKVSPESTSHGPLRRLPPLIAVPGKVRLIKDCLRVGRWYLGDDERGEKVYWDVTPEVLDTLERNFLEQWNAGYFHNLQWGHPSPRPGNSEQIVVDYIRHLWHEDGVLYFGVYVTPEMAAKLQEKHRQVSVRVIDEFHTQDGMHWGATLIHVAIVDHGAVPLQMPFKELSAKTSQRRDVAVGKQLAFTDQVSGVGDNPTEKSSSSEAKSMDIAALVELINQMLAWKSETAKLPTEGDNAVTEENLVAMLAFTLEVLGEAAVETEDPPVVEDPAVPASAELDALTKLVKDLSSKFDRMEQGQKATARQSYEAAVEALCKGGLPAAAGKQLKDLGAKLGWDQSALEPYRSIPGVKLGSQTKAFNSSVAPSVRFSDEEKAKARKLLGLS